jgi:hypothetical protein
MEEGHQTVDIGWSKVPAQANGGGREHIAHQMGHQLLVSSSTRREEDQHLVVGREGWSALIFATDTQIDSVSELEGFPIASARA